MKTKTIALLDMLLIASSGNCQDPTFSQFSSVPLYFNPAFAGSVEISRLSFSYRNQWNNSYQTGCMSYDQSIKKLHGGVGLLIFDDGAGEGTLNTFYTGVVYAPKFNISKKIALSPGIKAGYLRKSVHLNDPMLNEQLYPANAPDFSLGLLINTENAYVAFSADHITQPDMSLTQQGDSKLPVKYVVQAGYTLQKKDSADFSVSINGMYEQQSNFSHLQVNVVGRYKWFMLGAAYGNGFTGLLGYYNRKVVVGYSMDYYYNMPEQFRFANEISLRCFFTLKRKK